MNIYISGISGTGMGPLALMAKAAGFNVFGSDLAEGPVTRELATAGINFEIGKQDGEFLRKCIAEDGVDWLVHTSALPAEHPELSVAKEAGIKISKRDELIAYLTEKMGLKMVAIAGTHGKTTTTSMITWTCLSLGLPVSYLIGTTLPFAEAGRYDKKSQFLVYEADEYDRNFLHFSPWLAVITTVSYDHPDIYPTKLDYMRAFAMFEGQSERVIRGGETEGKAVINNETVDLQNKFTLAGKLKRYDASLAMQAVFEMVEEADFTTAAAPLAEGLKSYEGRTVDEALIVEILNDFPGVGRRFERISDGVYSDYGHHPEEIAATIEMALEEAKMHGFTGVTAVYEPHQNVRQHEVFDDYATAFSGVSHLFWLPTYLTREDPNLVVIRPEEFIASLQGVSEATPAEMGDELAEKLRALRKDGELILLLSAGPADAWLRKIFSR